MCWFAIKFNGVNNVGWQNYEYLNYFLTIIAGMTSALAIIIISRWIGKSKTIEYIGKNTMSVLIFHKIIVVVAQTKLGSFSKLLMDSNIIIELCLSLITSIIAVIISIMIGLFFRKVLPGLIGEEKSIQHNKNTNQNT